MALTNLENYVVAIGLEGAKTAYIQNYLQPGLGIGIINFGPAFRNWQRTYDSMILDLMDKATAGVPDAAALSLLDTSFGRVFIKNSDGVTRTFFIDGLPRSIATGKDWCLHKSVADLVKLQASQLGYNITDTTAADYVTNGLIETFGD